MVALRAQAIQASGRCHGKIAIEIDQGVATGGNLEYRGEVGELLIDVTQDSCDVWGSLRSHALVAGLEPRAIFPRRVPGIRQQRGQGDCQLAPVAIRLPDPSIDPVKHMEKRLSEGKRPGGFGIHIIRGVMDEVSFNEKGNAVTMTKYLPRKESQEPAGVS